MLARQQSIVYFRGFRMRERTIFWREILTNTTYPLSYAFAPKNTPIVTEPSEFIRWKISLLKLPRKMTYTIWMAVSAVMHTRILAVFSIFQKKGRFSTFYCY